MLEDIFAILPEPLAAALRGVSPDWLAAAEEIRIREGRPLELVGAYGSRFVSRGGDLSDESARAMRPSAQDCARLLDRVTDHSLYSFSEELKQGFVTIRGGHRIGLAGGVVLERGAVKMIKDVGSFNIRIARQRPGAAASLLPRLLDRDEGTIQHTLIVSPPRHGKTTMLRDLIRMISAGEPPGLLRGGLKVGVVDERSELAGCVRGVPSFDLGPRTDVLDACPKAEGMMMLIRSMSPDVLAVDEIGRREDAAAIEEAVHAGIRVLATAHGRDVDDVRRRPVLAGLLEAGVFSRIAVLRRTDRSDPTVSVTDGMGFRQVPLAEKTLVYRQGGGP